MSTCHVLIKVDIFFYFPSLVYYNDLQNTIYGIFNSRQIYSIR